VSDEKNDDKLESLTYLQANPSVVLALDDHVLAENIVMNVYQEDGSPQILDKPSEKELTGIIQTMLTSIEQIELKTLVMVASIMHKLAGGALGNALQSLHQIAHDPELAPQLDEDLLCDGAYHYITEASYRQPEIKEVIPENSAEALKKFFPDKSKPN
jgi:hypothetical protein